MNAHLEKIVSADPAVLIDFYADWCTPCKWVIPVLEDVEKHFGGKLKLHKIDIDEHADLARSLTIMSVPTLILFREGREVWRMRGFDQSPTLIRTISEYLP